MSGWSDRYERERDAAIVKRAEDRAMVDAHLIERGLDWVVVPDWFYPLQADQIRRVGLVDDAAAS